ncbi:MAG TPA: hypothetical protein VFR48_09770 [Solirubrobacteraceae bacterium]|nr:hypothetical protein [Solirubrobacteraceae bacterium]
MSKILAMGPVLIAVLAFFALAASPAFAEDEWLANGVAIVGTPSVEGTAELTLVDLVKSSSSILEEITCSLTLQGIISSAKTLLVQDMVNLGGTIIGESGTNFLDCRVSANDKSAEACRNGSLVELWVDHLNLTTSLTWPMEIELMTEEPKFLGKFLEEEMGYKIRCEVELGGVIEELCSGTTSVALENTIAGAAYTFNWEAPISSRFANCTGLGPETGGLKGSGVFRLTSGQTLSVS